KRAVKFPFLDFSTRDRRLRFCADEVSLNGRIAPDLYLGVAPVLRDGEGFRLGQILQSAEEGAGAEDWLVVMRRFDQERLLVNVAERGELTAAMIGDLARKIARFHAEAGCEPENGGGAVLRHTVEM